MINNTIQIAKKRLQEHKKMGNNTRMSIFEVAQLMDLINDLPKVKNPQKSSIYFNNIILN